MSRHEKKPKHRVIEFEIKILWFRLKFHHTVDW